MAQIHQELTFAAEPAAVYKALTDSEEFAKFTDATAVISHHDGGAFSCFDGAITGRNVELIENTRVVQAWRVFDWPDGLYSIVRFELAAEGDGTKLVMDHHGVPADAAAHVDPGWHKKYWEPLRRHLGG